MFLPLNGPRRAVAAAQQWVPHGGHGNGHGRASSVQARSLFSASFAAIASWSWRWNMETRWKQDENEMKTRWKRDENEMNTRKHRSGSRLCLSRCPKCFLQLFIPSLHVFAPASAYHTVKPEQGRIPFGDYLKPNIHGEAGAAEPTRNWVPEQRKWDVGTSGTIQSSFAFLFVPLVFWCASSEDSRKICS